MRYKSIRIDATESTYEQACSILLDSGVSGYEVIDDKPVDNPYDWDYEELKPDIKDMGGLVSVIFYLEEDEDERQIIDKIQKALPDCSISVSFSDEEDWRDKWKDYFHQFSIGDILITPSWEEVKTREGKVVIEIDPGISFGTGAHETTRMCIAKLNELGLKDMSVLDAGCGSGILSIAAKKLGAKKVVCIDIDPDCIDTTKENLIKNGCDVEEFDFYCGDITKDKRIYDAIPDKSFDVVVANILADIIAGMLPKLAAKIKPDGTVILSGIIEGKEDIVLLAMEKEGIKVVDKVKDGEWYMIAGML